MASLTCKTATLSELSTMLSWAKQEGWNPGLNDSLPFFNVDPTGFFIGYLGDEPIACISAVKYPNQFGFVGFYIVKPAYRGKGYGIQLWQHAINYLRGYNIGLDGVILQQPNYAKSGFVLAHRNIRFKGQVAVPSQIGLTPIHEVNFDAVVDFDKMMFPALRTRFLSDWFSMPNSQTLVKLDQQRVLGYGTIRQCHEGYKIGPLFANDEATAEALLIGLTEFANQQTVFLDIPETNSKGLALANRFNFTSVFETARMYTKRPPAINPANVFGITSFELG